MTFFTSCYFCDLLVNKDHHEQSLPQSGSLIQKSRSNFHDSNELRSPKFIIDPGKNQTRRLQLRMNSPRN